MPTSTGQVAVASETSEGSLRPMGCAEAHLATCYRFGVKCVKDLSPPPAQVSFSINTHESAETKIDEAGKPSDRPPAKRVQVIG